VRVGHEVNGFVCFGSQQRGENVYCLQIILKEWANEERESTQRLNTVYQVLCIDLADWGCEAI
jgi:hypothetical protein